MKKGNRIRKWQSRQRELLKPFYKLILYLLINCGFYRGNEFVILIVSQFLYGFQQVLIY